ncbi:MAG: nitroreductase family protein, partial [Candidatus Puniceispirillaceae bacterium]
MSEIVQFLKERRSVIVKNLLPVPVPQSDIDDIIACGLRVPDHGVLGPWHITIIDGKAGAHLGKTIL